MPAYTTAAAIASHLGVTFTVPQTAEAGTVAQAVTTLIDHRTGRTWQAAGAIVDELHTIGANRVYLTHPPVTAVSGVSVHPGTEVGTWTPLAATAYELTDPAVGIVTLSSGYNGQYAQVDYTSGSSGAPEDVELAATILAGDLLFATLNPESAGAESISVGQNDISVRYAGAGGTNSSAVVNALRVIDSYRRVVLA